jgi:hypothetical protein
MSKPNGHVRLGSYPRRDGVLVRTSVRVLARLGLQPPSPSARLGQRIIALAEARELDFVSLPDALELVLLLIDDPGRFRAGGASLARPLLLRRP